MTMAPNLTKAVAGQTKTAAARYCFYIPEGVGYIWVGNLGTGNDGVVDLVRDSVSLKLFVRKRVLPSRLKSENYDPGVAAQHHQPETLVMRHHPLVTRIIDWTEYRPLLMSDSEYLDWGNASNIQNFCNAGTLDDLIDEYWKRAPAALESHRLQACPDYISCYREHVYDPIPGVRAARMPEAMIWKAFGSLVKTVSFIHQANPIVQHHDIQSFNVFLHYDKDCDRELPQCILGDWGKGSLVHGMVREQENLATWRTRLLGDYRCISYTVKAMMTLCNRASYEDPVVSQLFDKCEQVDHPGTDLQVWQYNRDIEGNLINTDVALKNVTAQHGQDELYWTRIVDKYDEDPNNPIPDRLQDSRDNATYVYSAKLYSTIRQFDRMIAQHNADSTLPNLSYYADKLLEMSSSRLAKDPGSQQARTVLYPHLDNGFLQYIQGRVKKAENKVWHYNWRDINEMANDESRKPYSGPWKIALLDDDNQTVKAFSKTTYNAYGPFKPGMTRQLRADDLAFRGSEREDPDLNRAATRIRIGTIKIGQGAQSNS